MNKYFQIISKFIYSINEKGFFHLLSANVLIQIIGFGSQFIVAWLLTPQQLGQIKIMQTFLSIALLFATFGFTTSVLKLCSENRIQGEKLFIYKKAIKYVSFSLLITWPTLFVITKLGFISSDKEIIRLFPYFSLALIPMVFTEIYSNYLQAIKQIKLFSKIQSITKTISVVTIIILTYLLGFNGYVLAFLLSFVFTFFIIKNRISFLNKHVCIVEIEQPLQTHWKYSAVSFLTLLVYQIVLYSDVFLMNYFISDRVVIGYYSFALTMTMINYIFTTTVQQIVIPHLSAKATNKNEIKVVTKKFERVNNIASIFIVIFLVIVVPILVKLIFGSKFEQSIPFYIVLVFAWFFQNTVTFKGYTLLGTGKIKYNLIISIINLFFGFSISYLLMNRYGIMGLAYGKLISNFISIFIVSILYKIGMKE
ncbi:MAG: lipopolysaccharide biosynthesis protein [Bacteroidia bacterium]